MGVRTMPVVDLGGLAGETTTKETTMAALKDACENWGFFQIVNHGVSTELMEKMKKLAHEHHDNILKPSFQASEVVKRVVDGGESEIRDTDWETCFFVQHLPTSNAGQVPHISSHLLETIREYEQEVVKLAERMLSLLCGNLGLEEDYIKKAFSGVDGPFMGTKFAKYPSCPRADAVRGLRTHTDAGGIILVLQDDVPGLQFHKEGEWVDVVPVADSIFVNTGDQLEVISNGRIKSIPHRVVAQSDGAGRISIATFYNPASDAVIGPAPKLLYPCYTFEQYMKVYAGTKFAEKEPRFEVMRAKSTAHLHNGQLDDAPVDVVY